MVRLLVLASAVGLGPVWRRWPSLPVENGLENMLWTSVAEQFGWSEPGTWWVVLVLVAGAQGVYAARKIPGHGGHSPLDGFKLDIGPRTSSVRCLPRCSRWSRVRFSGRQASLMATGSTVGAALAARATPEVRRRPPALVTDARSGRGGSGLGESRRPPMDTALGVDLATDARQDARYRVVPKSGELSEGLDGLG